MFKKLHALRGVSACLVILFHSPYKYAEDAFSLVSNLYLFVDLFFLLSGFVMAYAYTDRILTGMSSYRYMSLRFARIYPLHAAMLAIWLVFILVRHYLYRSGVGGENQFIENNTGTFIANIFLLHAMGVTESLSWNQPSWSIAAEFYTYLLFFVSTRFLDRGRSLLFPLGVALVCYGYLFFVLRPQTLDLTFDYGFLRCVPAFYLGVFVFRIQRHVEVTLSGKRIVWAEVAAVAVVVLALLYARETTAVLIVTPLCFTLALLVFSMPASGPIGVLLHAAWLQSLGLWSYSIYMTHKLVLVVSANIAEYILGVDLVRPLGWLSPVINTALILIVIALSRLSYIHIEQYFRDRITAALGRKAYSQVGHKHP